MAFARTGSPMIWGHEGSAQGQARQAALPDASPQAKAVTRSRTGCHQCRKKRVKCTEEKPTCRRCNRSGTVCEYELRLLWEEDAIALNKCHGRAGVWSKTASGQAAPSVASPKDEDTELPPVTNVTTPGMSEGRNHDGAVVSMNDIAISEEYSAQSQTQLSPVDSAHSTPITRSPDTFTALKINGHLFSHFFFVMCPKVSVADDVTHNPLRGVILPLGLGSELGSSAIMMMSAHYLGASNPDPRYRLIELQMRQNTIVGLRKALASKTWDGNTVLLAALMLCSSDIANSNNPDWMAQLMGLRELLSAKHHPFFSAYFVAHTVFARTCIVAGSTAGGEDGYPGVSKTKRRRSQPALSPRSSLSWMTSDSIERILNKDDCDVIGTWNGLSNRLLLLINDVSTLRDEASFLSQYHPGGIHLRACIFRSTQLADKLAFLDQRLPATLADGDAYATPRSLLIRTAEAYRIAAILYLKEVARFIIARCPMNEEDQTITIVLDAERRRSLIQSLLNNIEVAITEKDLSVSWPLWPLFIAGCMAEKEDDKRRVLVLFEAARSKSPYENIERARSVVEAVWQKHEVTSTCESDSNNDRYVCVWEKVVSDKGKGLSLA